MKEVVVLGGGLAGLVVADKLQDNGFKVTIVEKADCVGGMCRSKIWYPKEGGRVVYDLGPHKFAPCSDIARDYFLKYIKHPITVPITGAVYLKGRLLGYPPKVIEILRNFPSVGIRCGISFLMKFLWYDDGTYANYIRKRVGSYTYDFVFRDYADKVWGSPARLDMELAKTRFVTPKLTDMITNTITGKNTLTFKDFIYPNVCIGVFIKKIEANIRDRGVVILNNTIPVSYDGKKLKVSDGKKETTFNNPLIISTIKPRNVAGIMRVLSIPLSKLNYRTVNFFYFLVRGERPKNTWIFYPEKRILFNRTSINFHPKAVEGGRYLICVEVTKRKKDIPDLKRADIERQLEEIYGIKKEDVLDMWNDFLDGAYPVYHVGFKDDIKNVLNMIEAHGNIYCLGRHACHNYNNMDHTIVEATDLADIISHGGAIDVWQKKREYYDWKIID